MGVIEIDPVQLLEDGLRSGIARRITAALATHSQVCSWLLTPLSRWAKYYCTCGHPSWILMTVLPRALQFPQHRGPPLAVLAGSLKHDAAGSSLLSVFGGRGGSAANEVPGRYGMF
jgi:hypothetical protein